MFYFQIILIKLTCWHLEIWPLCFTFTRSQQIYEYDFDFSSGYYAIGAVSLIIEMLTVQFLCLFVIIGRNKAAEIIQISQPFSYLLGVRCIQFIHAVECQNVCPKSIQRCLTSFWESLCGDTTFGRSSNVRNMISCNSKMTYSIRPPGSYLLTHFYILQNNKPVEWGSYTIIWFRIFHIYSQLKPFLFLPWSPQAI